MFVYQPIFNTLELKDGKVTNYVIGYKSKGVYTSKVKPLCTTFLHDIKFPACRIEMQFSKDVLLVEQNNHATKIVNVNINI